MTAHRQEKKFLVGSQLLGLTCVEVCVRLSNTLVHNWWKMFTIVTLLNHNVQLTSQLKCHSNLFSVLQRNISFLIWVACSVSDFMWMFKIFAPFGVSRSFAASVNRFVCNQSSTWPYPVISVSTTNRSELVSFCARIETVNFLWPAKTADWTFFLQTSLLQQYYFNVVCSSGHYSLNCSESTFSVRTYW